MTDNPLTAVLQNINAARGRGTPDLALLKEYARNQSIMRHLDRADNRLAVYGSLAPGEINHDKLNGLAGDWQQGSVRGRLAPKGWGEHVGFPGITWDPSAGSVAVQIFTSAQLPGRWPALDAFEGHDYRRILVPVETPDAIIVANLYEVAAQAS